MRRNAHKGLPPSTRFASACKEKETSDAIQWRNGQGIPVLYYVHNCDLNLEILMTQRIGVRELREKLSSFLESSELIEVTRHGQTIGFFIPTPRRPGQAEREALLEAGKRLDEELIRLGLKEDELLKEFKQWRRQRNHAA
jgi:antitoxin (DNA-binding transcriptional repressor) of toxin-antitoxin stability system